MRTESHPYNYLIKERFAELRLVKQFEGGRLSIAEKGGFYYLVIDEGTMADFLLPDDKDDLLELVTILEFDSEKEREQYIQKRGWGWNNKPINNIKGGNMTAYEYIISRQIEWANNRGKKLTGSQGERGRKVYTVSIEDNLYQPLNERTREELEHGDGGELTGSEDQPAKFQALHSSSALGINVFDYWRSKVDLSILTSACGFTASESKVSGEIHFEQKYSIDSHFRYAPNIDAVIKPDKAGKYKVFAIECKFTEAYSTHNHNGLKDKYFENEGFWQNLPNTRVHAQEIRNEDNHFKNLHAAQLIKHILGLNREYGHSRYRLLYLWYDSLGDQGSNHRKEIEEFSEIVQSDGVIFHDMSYQELIIRLAKQRKDHPEYISYLTERYL